MTKQEAAKILDKARYCGMADNDVCANRTCDDCPLYVDPAEICDAMKMAIDILKEGEKDGE